MCPKDATNHSPTRRQFLQGAAASSVVLGAAAGAMKVHAAGSDVIRVGLIGCGGRGSGAAVNAMKSGSDVRLVAMADLFSDRLQSSRKLLAAQYPQQVDVPDERCFHGLDGYRQVIASGVDVVLIAAASHFHPVHLQAAVEAGKHVFCEKPHALDVPGLKLVMAAAEEARRNRRCLVSGLCWRYDPGVREAMQRIADGAIGQIIAIRESYLTNPYIVREREPGWTEMEYQLRNWYHFNWLSGDQTAQQLIHSIDKASWALGDRPPQRAWGLGGRQVCLEPKYGDQFDHHSVVYEYEGGVQVFGFCRDILGCHNETTDVILGTQGQAYLPQKPRIEGEQPWQYSGPKTSMYDAEHQDLFAAIREGRTIDNSGYMVTSTMLAILAQMVCYTGRVITWDEAMNSTRSFTPASYALDAQPPVLPDVDGRYPTAIPGVTREF